jgi:hypothetical protein
MNENKKYWWVYIQGYLFDRPVNTGSDIRFVQAETKEEATEKAEKEYQKTYQGIGNMGYKYKIIGIKEEKRDLKSIISDYLKENTKYFRFKRFSYEHKYAVGIIICLLIIIG